MVTDQKKDRNSDWSRCECPASAEN